MKKKVILVMTAYYLPGYKSGGPVRTISNMVEHLGDTCDFWIITSDRDSLDSKPYDNIIINEWNTVGKAKVLYLSKSNRSFYKLSNLFKSIPYDILYLNSFFRYDFTIKPLILRYLGFLKNKLVILAPRGEFSNNALNIGMIKKRIFIKIVKIMRLYDNLRWHASSKYERNDIEKIMQPKTLDIRLAMNLSEVRNTNHQDYHIKKEYMAPLRICFISRITPMKNLTYALEILNEISLPIEFNIYGLIDNEENYWPKCIKIISLLPKNVIANYHGILNHDEVIHVMKSHNLLFLPTLGENYGHVIMEAFSAGIPVLISNLTPWRNLEEKGIGWDIPLEERYKFIEIINKLYFQTNHEYSMQRVKIMDFYNKATTDHSIVKDNIELFN